MTNGNLYMAIDVGTTKVCTLIAQVSPEGELEIVGTGVEPSRGMKKGLVVEIDEMKEAVVDSVAKASVSLERELPGACIGVTGAHIISVHTSATLPNLNGDPNKVITRAEMDQVIKQSHPKVGSGQELIHVIPQNYIVDNVGGVRNPVGLKGHQLTVESHLSLIHI